MVNHAELLFRIVAGSALGAVIGYERDRHKRPVGLRTHLLVAMAAATFMVVSSHFVYFQHYQDGDHVEVDTSRIAASVVSGIGFLAGGAILRHGATIQGLTTAAGLWLVTAIGLCAGAGMYIESVCVTFMGITALTVFRRFEDKNDLVVRRRVLVAFIGVDGASFERLGDILKTLGVAITDVKYERRFVTRRVSVTFDVTFPVNLRVMDVISQIESFPGVRRVSIESPM